MLLNEYKRNFFRLLNEGAAEMYRDSYYPEVDDYILEKIIEIDPESNGDDLSDFGKLLLKLNPQMSDFEQLRKDIDIFAKAVRNGAEVPDVKTVEELHYAAVDLANSNAHMSGDEVNAQEKSLGCPTVYSDGGYRVISICNQEAAVFYGKGTMWIWSANDGKMFDQYSQRGKIYVILKGSEKFSAIRMGSRLRITDAQDENVSKDMFPQEMLTALTGVNENKNVRLSENELMDMLVEAVENKVSQTKKVKLTESRLKKMISESVKKAINEIAWKETYYGPREIIQMIDNGMFDDEVKKFIKNGDIDVNILRKTVDKIVTKYNLNPMDEYVVAINLGDRANFVDSKIGSNTLYKQRDNAKHWDEEQWDYDKKAYLKGYDLRADRRYTNDVSQHVPY